MTDQQKDELLQAMRAAVQSGRMMRARQNAYFKSRKTEQLITARIAEQEFDTLSLKAVRLDQQFREEGENA